MVDIFGLKKEPEAPAPEPAPVKPGRHKLWAALLVIDSAFIIVFGGAVAAKLYEHLKAPAAPAAPQAGRNRPAKPPTPPAEASKPAPAEAPPAAKVETPAPEPAKPVEDGPKAPKPSLVIEAPKRREAPQPQAAGAQAGSADKRHSVPVEFKLKAPRARSVHLAGAFIVRGGRREMVQQDQGLWTLTLYLLPGTEYRYWFIVDGKRTLDPENSKVVRGASLLSLP